MSEEQTQEIKQIIEALLFAASEPIPLKKIQETLSTTHEIDKKQLYALIENLKEEYNSQQRAFQLEEIAKGFMLRTREKYRPYIESFHQTKRNDKLSHAASEVVAIITYRQPVTKAQIEEIRGVDCSGILSNLQDRQLVQPVGTLDVPGRPTLYGTTLEFLKYYGLKDLIDLPQISSDKSKLAPDEHR